MKNNSFRLLICCGCLLAASLLLSSCSSLHQASQTPAAAPPVVKSEPIKTNGPTLQSPKDTLVKAKPNTQGGENNCSNAETLKTKYAEKMQVKPGDIKDLELYALIDEWMGVPYHWGGTSKQGCDCVGLCKVFYKELYDKTLSGSAGDVYALCNEVKNKADLKEGDFVFFKINQSQISHIGIYLQNGYFVHAPLTGVMIDNLNEPYYKTYYFTGGRLKS